MIPTLAILESEQITLAPRDAQEDHPQHALMIDDRHMMIEGHPKTADIHTTIEPVMAATKISMPLLVLVMIVLQDRQATRAIAFVTA